MVEGLVELLMEPVGRRLHADEPVAVTAPTVMEVLTGIQATATTDRAWAPH
jgi:hypothetical protein